MTQEQYVPPILAREGVSFVGVEDIPDGGTRMVFSTPDEQHHQSLVKVSVVSQSKLHYTYAIFDADTDTHLFYEGPYGDPSRDTLREIDGWS